MSRVVMSLAALTAAVAGVVVLVPPALAEATASSSQAAPAGPVAVALAGHLDTAGLGQHATVSRLTVTNTGENALAWSLRPGTASPVTVDYWPAGAAPCATVAPTSTSAGAPLAAGGSVDVCVRLSPSATASGSVVPVVTVVAQPA